MAACSVGAGTGNRISPMNAQSARGIRAPKVELLIQSIDGVERSTYSKKRGEMPLLVRSTKNSPTHSSVRLGMDNLRQIGSEFAE